SLAPLSYPWFDGAAIVAGATNATFILNSVPAFESWSQFSCVVSNVNGAVASAMAALIVTNAPPVFSVTVPSSPDGLIQMTVIGPPGGVFSVAASSNLLNWQTN